MKDFVQGLERRLKSRPYIQDAFFKAEFEINFLNKIIIKASETLSEEFLISSAKEDFSSRLLDNCQIVIDRDRSLNPLISVFSYDIEPPLSELHIEIPKELSSSFKELLNQYLNSLLLDNLSKNVLKKLKPKYRIALAFEATYVCDRFGAFLVYFVTRAQTQTFIVKWQTLDSKYIDPSTPNLTSENIKFTSGEFPTYELISDIYISPSFDLLYPYLPKREISFPVIVESIDRELFLHFRLNETVSSELIPNFLDTYFTDYITRSDAPNWTDGFIGQFDCVSNQNSLLIYYLDMRDAKPKFFEEILIELDRLEKIKLLVISDLDAVDWEKYDFI